MRPIKESNDANIIDNGMKSIYDFGKDELLPHFIYCGYHYLSFEARRRLKNIFLEKMENYEVSFSILTGLIMWRQRLITKETVQKAYQGKLKRNEGWRPFRGSIHDDLEMFFRNLQNQKKKDKT